MLSSRTCFASGRSACGGRNGGEVLLHTQAHGAIGHDATSGIVQARARGDVGNIVRKRLGHRLEQRAVLLALLGDLLLLLLGLKTKVLAAGDITHFLVVIAADGEQAELVDIVAAEQDVVAARDDRRDARALGQACDGVTGSKEDAFLALLHAGDVLGQRDGLVLLGGVEEQQVLQQVLARAIGRVDVVLEHMAELAEEVDIGLAVILAELLELLLDLLLDATLDGDELAVLLERLARDVEVEVGTVDDAAHEAEAVRQQVLAVLHDHDVVAVERQPSLEVLGVQVHGRIRGDEEQRVVVQATLGVHGDGAQGRIGRMELGLVEIGILLVGDLRLLLGPDGNHRVEDFLLDVRFGCGHVVIAGILRLGQRARLLHVHEDGVADVIAVALDQVLDERLGRGTRRS